LIVGGMALSSLMSAYGFSNGFLIAPSCRQGTPQAARVAKLQFVGLLGLRLR
jgi:hypothetical protein